MRLQNLQTVLWIALFSISISSVYADTDYRVSAAKGPYFVCDDRVTEDRWMTERFTVQAQRHQDNPLIVKTAPWEGTGPHLGGTVLYDPEDQLHKMWYSVWNKHAYYNGLPFSYNICYTESDDGIQWRKPSLGVFDYEGSTDNNCIRLGTDKTQNIDVCLNPLPDRYPGKFLAIHNQKGGVFVSSSDDGKSFTWLWDKPAISYHSDTHNNFVYDECRDRWLLFCRPRAYAGDHKRRVSMQMSRDLQTWTHERTILVPTETEKMEFYGMPVFRRGDLFFGALQIYDRITGFMHSELAWSGDGEHWNQIATHPPFFQRGETGQWDAGMVIVGESPVMHGDEMWFYYGGFALQHNAKEDNPTGIGVAISERDRLVGVRPLQGETGYLLTRPLSVSNDANLRINTIVKGQIRVEIRTDNNKPVDGFTFEDCTPLTTSGFDCQVGWQGKKLGDVPLNEFRIRFELDQAELFTFNIEA